MKNVNLRSVWTSVADRLLCRADKTAGSDGRPKTVNIFIGFFFMVNFVLGTGFLGIPFAFFHAGLLAGVFTLAIISFISWNTAIWEVEVMARAQAVTDHYKSDCDDATEVTCPKFEIVLSRKFEPSELCEVFVGRWLKYVYLIMLSAYTFLACISYSTVAGTAWSVNLPLNFGTLQECTNLNFLHENLPTVIPCRNAYWFCLFLFACIVIPLSIIELKEQMIVQVFLGILRFFTLAAIITFSVINLITEQNINTCQQPWSTFNSSDNASCKVNTTFEEIVTRFHAQNWLLAIPVFVYAHILHQGVPALTHPIKQKQYLGAYFNILFLVIGSLYMILGITVSLWFKDCTNETCTLSWDPLTHLPFNLSLRILSYYIILFPSIDVISVYPLVVLTMVDNIYTVFFGKDSSQASKTWTTFFIRMGMKFVSAILPILVALAVSNLVTVLKFAGLIGFFICFFIPTLLQLSSQWICVKTFKAALEPRTTLQDNSFCSDNEQPRAKSAENAPLITSPQVKPSELYMTPYSNIFSYWPAVVIIGGVGVLLFALTVASLFFAPSKSLPCLHGNDTSVM